MKPAMTIRHVVRSAIRSVLIPVVAVSTAVAQTLPPLPELPDLAPSGPAYSQKSLAAPGGIEDSRIGTLEEGRKLEEAVREMVRAYETGNLALVESRIDPSMVGYQRFVEGVRRDASQLKQVRIQLIDLQVTVGPDVGVVRARFEKRYVNAVDFTPALISGQARMLFHRRGEFWNVAGFSGDNLFASSSGTLAQLTLAPASLFYAGTPTTTLQITDPDAIGLPALLVTVTTTAGDRETLSVPAIRPGVFSRPLTILPTLPTIGNGQLEENGAPFGDIVIRYTDPTPGDNRPPLQVVRTIRIQ